MKWIYLKLTVIASIVLGFACNTKEDAQSFDQTPQLIVDNLIFAEGPAYANGYLYFTDLAADKIYRWNDLSGVEVVLENSGGANGLFFNKNGHLFICEGKNKRVTSLTENLEISVIASAYNNLPFNEPNDLWISPSGDIYFTDPVFTGTLTQPGEYVYCIGASSKSIQIVCNNLVKPNGIVGNFEGTVLYVADYRASKIYKYNIESDGSLSNQVLFAQVQADGLSIDQQGNLYAAGKSILIFNVQGQLVKSIEVEGTLTNLFYSKKDNTEKLFVTTHNCVLMISL